MSVPVIRRAKHPVIKQHPVVSYYVLAFAISWGAILIVVGPGGFLETTATSPSFALVGFASLLGPSVAGLVLTGVLDGRAGLRELWSRLLRWRVQPRWYVVALLTAPLISTAIVLAMSFTAPEVVPAIVAAEEKASLVLYAVAVSLGVALLEELGWTGFVTPRLRLRHGVLATGLIMGILWGAWHLPMFAGSARESGQIYPVLFLAAMLFSWLPPYRVLMVWVYDRTQSLLIVVLMHVQIVVGQLLLSSAMSGEQRFGSLIAYGLGLWLVVGAVALVDHGHLTRKQPGPSRAGVDASPRPQQASYVRHEVSDPHRVDLTRGS